jgi:hypothetical protein
MNGSILTRIPGFDRLPFAHQESASKIFISYRREDARGDAGRLTDKLKAHFGDKQIFRDVEALEPGVDFVDALNRAVSSCAVLLAVIGPNWIKVSSADGARRLDDPNDFIRLEIGAALSRDVRVIPVLVGDAPMPTVEQLPGDLVGLSRRQAHELSDSRWDYDVDHLIATLEKVGIVPAIRRPDPKKNSWTKSRIAVALGSLALFIGGYLYSEHENVIDEWFEPSSPPGFVSPQALNPYPVAGPPAVMTDLAPPAVPNRPAERAIDPATKPTIAYAGMDAIGRKPSIVQVYDPG